MTRSRNPYLAIELRIAADERGGILHRWRYGRKLLEAKTGRKQLPHGMAADLVKAATSAGLKLSEREIQFRLKCAETYETEAKVRTASSDFGSWTALRDAGFPPVQSTDPDDLEAAGFSLEPPDAWEQGTLIPGFGETIKVSGRRVPVAAATVGQAKAYLEEYRRIHESFGKTLAQIEASVTAMVDGSGGDDEANAVEAWNRGTEIL